MVEHNRRFFSFLSQPFNVGIQWEDFTKGLGDQILLICGLIISWGLRILFMIDHASPPVSKFGFPTGKKEHREMEERKREGKKGRKDVLELFMWLG